MNPVIPNKRRQTKIINLEFNLANRTSSQKINIPYNVDHVILKNFSFVNTFPEDFSVALISSNLFRDPFFFIGSKTSRNETTLEETSEYVSFIYNTNLYCEITNELVNNTFDFYITDKNGSLLNVNNLSLFVTIQLEFVEK